MATPNLGFQNYFSTTLTSGITAADTTIPLNSLPTASEGYLVIEPDNTSSREIIYYTSKTGSAVICPSAAAGRGIGGTTATSHSGNAAVKMNVVAQMFTALQDGTAFTAGAIGASAYASGWVSTAVPTPNTVTHNGNRSYSLVFNATDLTSYISPGMRLKATRTVTAPTQCTSLNGTTQYYNKTSPSAMTFTDDFVVSAWVKLSSYALGTVVSRFSSSGSNNGWSLDVNASGQVLLYGLNASTSRTITSNQSIPLNKWVHIAAQLDMSASTATTTTCYVMIDGIDVPSAVTSAGGTPSTLVQAGNLDIGTRNSAVTAQQFFPGKIAQVAIYNAKVTQAVVTASISQGLAGTETSLISAYSFNGVITDLSANANNLSAQASAVATTVDSPFALGSDASTAYTAGTTEYGIVQSVVFSTNTTIIIQAPLGGPWPTSGGISALAWSIQKTPLGFPSSRARWRLESIDRITASQSAPVAGTWYNFNSDQLYVPVGEWVLGYEASLYGSKAAANSVSAKSTLSTGATTESDTDLTSAIMASSVTEISSEIKREKGISQTAAGARYLNSTTVDGSMQNIQNLNTRAPSLIYAENAYV